MKRQEDWPKIIIRQYKNMWFVIHLESNSTYTHGRPIEEYSKEELVRILKIFTGPEVHYDSTFLLDDTIDDLKKRFRKRRFIGHKMEDEDWMKTTSDKIIKETYKTREEFDKGEGVTEIEFEGEGISIEELIDRLTNKTE